MDRPAVFINCPRFTDEESQSPSPTSSLRGVYSRSRPVSYAPSECPTIASECQAISHVGSDSSDYSSDVSTPATSTTHDALYMSFKLTPKPQDTEPSRVSTEDEMYEGLSTPKAIPASSQVKSSNTTLLSRTVHPFLPRKAKTPTSTTQLAPDVMGIEVPSLPSALEHAEDIPPLTPSKSERHSWRAIRRTVSHILHRDRKEKEKEKDISLPSSARPIIISSPRALKPSKSASLKLKSSSASIFTQRSRRFEKRLTISPPPRVLSQQQTQALARKQRLHRSRSFSGYPNVLAAIADDCSDLDTDVGLDEATMEAQEVMKELQRKQAFAKIQGMDRDDGSDEIMFERCVKAV